MSYIYLFATVLLTVYGQIVIKWQAAQAGPLPVEPVAKLVFLLRLVFLNPWVLSGFFAAFLASLTWLAVVTRLPLSHAYPFVSFSFVLVVLSGAVFFHEPLTWPKIAGMLLIIAGIAIGSQG